MAQPRACPWGPFLAAGWTWAFRPSRRPAGSQRRPPREGSARAVRNLAGSGVPGARGSSQYPEAQHDPDRLRGARPGKGRLGQVGCQVSVSPAAEARSGLAGVAGGLPPPPRLAGGLRGGGPAQPPLRPRRESHPSVSKLCRAGATRGDPLRSRAERGPGRRRAASGPSHREPFPGRMLFEADPARPVTRAQTEVRAEEPEPEQVSGAPACGRRWAWQRWRPCGEASFVLAPCSACPAWRCPCCCWCRCQTPPR